LEQPARTEDQELVRRILAGDEEAFEFLVREHHARLFRVVQGILGDWQRSEDALQEVFVNVHLRIGGFRHRSSLSTWLYRIAVNTALKHRTRRARHQEARLEVVGEGPSDTDPHAGRFEGDELFDKLLRPLPAHLRTVVVLKEREGLSYKEIAAVLECTQGAVEQRLHRAFCTLREVWKGRREAFGELL